MKSRFKELRRQYGLTQDEFRKQFNQEYGRHYSVSRIVDGKMEMVFLGIGREGRRFGMTNDLPEGDYLLASGNRLSDGSTPVTVTLFHVTPGESLQVPVIIETGVSLKWKYFMSRI